MANTYTRPVDQAVFAQEVLGLIKDRQRKRTRREAVGKILGGLITDAVTWLTSGWLFMLAIGIAHAEWFPAIPTIGFWWAVLIANTLRAALSSRSTTGKDDVK